MSSETQLTKYCNKPSTTIFRKKPIQLDNESSPLKKCLNLLDLTFLSIGSIIGSGIFVFAGDSIRNIAGPGVVLSFLIAAIPSLISALCYAEFGARVPKAGSTYDFIYVSLGEFWAAQIGWFLITSPMFYGASVALSWTAYFDSLFNGWIANHTKESLGVFDSPYLSEYPDFLAVGIVVIICLIVGAGAKCSTQFNNVFVIVKLVIIAFVICYGFSFANGQYWTNPEYGGFMPFGFSGVIAATPSAFYSYTGYEQACVAGEEAKNPVRDLVWAIVMAFIATAVAYILMCTSITLMVPYYEISESSSFADAFAQRGASWAKFVVSIGALSALTNVLFASIFPVPRFVYTMASDGLLYRWLSVVNEWTKVPIRPIAIYALVTILIIILFRVETLVEYLSLGGLLCDTLVCAGIIVLRYSPRIDDPQEETSGSLKSKFAGTILQTLFGRLSPGSTVTTLVSVEIVVMIALSALLTYAPWESPSSTRFCLFMVAITISAIVLILIQILVTAFVQNEDKNLWFRVPWVPFLPSTSIFMNVLMMLQLHWTTWVGTAIYLLTGVAIYAFYGYRHSLLRENLDQQHQHTKF